MSRRRGIMFLAVLVPLFFALVTLAVVLPDAPAPEHPVATQKKSTSSAATATSSTDPLQAARAAFTPTRLVVPKMNIDVVVIPVGTTSAGAMDAPRCDNESDPICNEVYWWNGGTVPGQRGNAVIAGHINRPNYDPAPFWNLHEMAVGDKLTVTVTNGQQLTFVVTSVETVSAYASGANNPVINDIFGPSLTDNVNLITCTGDWDGTTFDHRLVVHTQLVGTSPFPNS